MMKWFINLIKKPMKQTQTQICSIVFGEIKMKRRKERNNRKVKNRKRKIRSKNQIKNKPKNQKKLRIKRQLRKMPKRRSLKKRNRKIRVKIKKHQKLNSSQWILDAQTCLSTLKEEVRKHV